MLKANINNEFIDYTNTMRIFTKKILTLAVIGSFVMAQTALAQSVPDASATTDTAPVTTSTDQTSVPSPDTASVPPSAPTETPSVSQTTDQGASVLSNDAPTVSASASSTLGSTAAPDPSASSTPQQSVDLQGSIAPVQDTTNMQSAASSTLLEDTTNPETTSTGATSIPVVDATTSTSSDTAVGIVGQDTSTGEATPVAVSTSTLDVVAQNVDASTDTATSDVPTVVTPGKLASLPIKDAPPSPTYSFALTGKHIPSQRKVEDKEGTVVGEETVAAPLTSKVDNTTGEVTVSGQCSDAYFVVLLFKNATDYANDSRSYIVNRAYPCSQGAFSYAISDLPSTLLNGTYYLLVGQEGKTGTWKPITELTEITITKNQ